MKQSTLIIVLVLVAGGIGWYMYKAKKAAAPAPATATAVTERGGVSTSTTGQTNVATKRTPIVLV